MAKSSSSKRIRPALSPEARENQLIAMATDLAEKQLLEGTASSQVITHFLKQGTLKAQIELEKLKRENELLEAKTEAIKASKENSAIYEAAIEAMCRYAGLGDVDDD